MRSSLVVLHNLDLHYHVATPTPDAQKEGSGQPPDLAESSVSSRPARIHHHTATRSCDLITQPANHAVDVAPYTGYEAACSRSLRCLQSQTVGGTSNDALDVGPGLRARNPADMHAFLNLAAFLDAALPVAGSALFEPWVRLWSLSSPRLRSLWTDL